MIDIFFASVVLGLLTGFLAGLFGIGGGLVIVPVLVFLFTSHGFAPHLVLIMAVATSLAVIILTAIASVAAHHRLGSVVWAKVWLLCPGIIVGSMLGAVVAKHISADTLRLFLVFFLIYVGTQMALEIKPKQGTYSANRMIDFGVAIIIGMVSALIGIGGGTLTVPYLVHTQQPMRNAVAIASACGFPIAISGTISYMLLGWSVSELPEWSLGYVYLPAFVGTSLSSMLTAPLGAKLAHQLPASQLKRYFSILLYMMAAKLLWH